MKYVYKNNLDRFVQFAVRVWNVEMNFDEPERTALEGIERLKKFFKEIGLPVSLKEMNIAMTGWKKWRQNARTEEKLQSEIL